MPAQLFAEVDKLLDQSEIEKILLTLEEDMIKYEAAFKDLQYYKDQLTFIDKINPFGERDKKGEILKIEYEINDIAKIYNQDIAVIREKAARAIQSIDAFFAKFQVDGLIRSIQGIQARYIGGGRANVRHSGLEIIGKSQALKRAEDINITLQKTYGPMYHHCPSYAQFIKAYMLYLTEPYHLPLELKTV